MNQTTADKIIEIREKYDWKANFAALPRNYYYGEEAAEILALVSEPVYGTAYNFEKTPDLVVTKEVIVKKPLVVGVSEPDIRMRVWIPYSLKKGLMTSRCWIQDTPDDYPVSKFDGYEWVQFVAVNDPLESEPVEDLTWEVGGNIKPILATVYNGDTGEKIARVVFDEEYDPHEVAQTKED